MIKTRPVGRLIGLLGLAFVLTATAQQRAPQSGSVSIGADPTAAALKRALQQDPSLWDNYFNLGNYILKAGGTPEDAAQVLLRFPPFHQQHPLDPVAAASWANDAGSLFYALGLPALTRPFYRIAADLDTGSDASLCDAQRLRLLDGDFAGAAAIALERGNRFGNANAYRDYLSLLHVMGRSEEAWRTFAQLNDSFDSPQLWISALIAQRITGKSEADIRTWLLRPEIRGARSRAHHFATHEALWAFSTDRMPPAGDQRFVTELLDWARKQETVQPTFAWAYSMQYEYEKPGAARTHALAMTEYLDPASPRITKASAAERAAAKAWLDEHSPFVKESIGSVRAP